MEPKTNSYCITVDITGVKKALALDIAVAIKQALVDLQIYGDIQDFVITTGHVKDVL